MKWLEDLPTQNLHALTASICVVFYVGYSLVAGPEEYVVDAVGLFLLAYAGVEGARFFGKRRTHQRFADDPEVGDA